MHSIKRRRAQAPTDLPAHLSDGLTESVEWQAVLAKDLPACVLGDVVASLLANPASSQLTQAAIVHCRKSHGCTLKQQMQQLVEANVKEPDEVFSRKMGSLAGSMYELGDLLDKAEQWILLKGYKAAFELLSACVSKAADWEGRGSDGGGWDAWDTRADTLMLATLDHLTSAWTAAELKEQKAEMEGHQKAGCEYGYESVFLKSLAKLKALA